MANKMASQKANLRAKASKMNANRSWPWVIIRIVQILFSVIVLGVSLYLRFSYKVAAIKRRSAEDDDYGAIIPPWDLPDDNIHSGAEETAAEFHKSQNGWGLSPYVALAILMSTALTSALSAFASLLFYCCDKISLKFVMAWDVLLSLGWVAGSIFMGKLITENLGWSSNHWIANLYKGVFALAVITAFLFIVSSVLGFRLSKATSRSKGGKYAPMAMAPPYMAPQTYGETGHGATAPAFATYTGPATDGPHDPPAKLAAEQHR